MTLNPLCIEELKSWSSQLHHWNGRDVHPKAPDMMINTDASLTGWGAVCNSVCTGGLRSPAERSLHINHLELLCSSILSKGQAEHPCPPSNGQQHCCFYVSRMGDPFTKSNGTSLPPMVEVPTEENNLIGRISTCNWVADRESRRLQMSAEWKLDEEVFRTVCQRLRPRDQFASCLNNQLEKYVSWRPDPLQ